MSQPATENTHGVKMHRQWAMPNRWTFSVPPITELVGRYIHQGVWADPFVGKSIFAKYCQFTNDLDPKVDATHHMDSLEFLQQLAPDSLDGILFDPPYSPRQIAECYKGVGREVHIEDTQISFYSLRKAAAAAAVKPGGLALCFGWNSGGFGKKLGFELVEVLLVCHGSAHNDTICTVERKQAAHHHAGLGLEAFL